MQTLCQESNVWNSNFPKACWIICLAPKVDCLVTQLHKAHLYSLFHHSPHWNHFTKPLIRIFTTSVSTWYFLRPWLHSTPPLTRLSPELKIPLIAICKLSVKGTHSSPDSSFLCCPLLSNQWLSNSGYRPRCPEVRAVVCFFFLLEK